MKRKGLWGGIALLATLWVSASGAATSSLKATIIDRYGNQHQVDKFTFQGRQDLEIYVQGQRRLVKLVKVARLRFEGERSDEEQRVLLIFRNGGPRSGLDGDGWLFFTPPRRRRRWK